MGSYYILVRMLVRLFSDQIRGFILQHFVCLEYFSGLFWRPGEDQSEVGQQTDTGDVLEGTGVPEMRFREFCTYLMTRAAEDQLHTFKST